MEFHLEVKNPSLYGRAISSLTLTLTSKQVNSHLNELVWTLLSPQIHIKMLTRFSFLC